MQRPALAALVAALALAPSARAQQPPAPDVRPAGWQRSLDRAGHADTSLAFVRMPPGWHVTAGPGGVVYDSATVARGRVRLESQLFLFSRAPEVGAGIAFGGARDATGAFRYLAFVVGPDGRFRVTRHDGARTTELVPWTAHPAVTVRAADRPNVEERLAVEADDASVRFVVNGQAVATLPRTEASPDGVVGLRVDPGANAHVATLVVDGRNLAPVPQKAP